MWIFNAIANAVGRNFIGTPNYLFGLLFNRVQADGGVTEAQQCTINELTELQNENLLSSASLVLTPSSYKESKLYSLIPTNGNGDFTFTRATTATRVNSSGLVELVPYNLLQYSEQFDNAYWIKPNATVTNNTVIAPNGTLTADTISFGPSGTVQKTLLNNGNMTFSIYAKYISTQWLFIENYNNADLGAWFDIQNGVIGTIASGVTANIENAGNGWFRCSVTMLTTNASNSIYAAFNTTANGNYTRTGSAYFWGAQVNEGTAALPYQKTETRLNIPRLDYSLGGCPSLLLEPQRTNLAFYSQEFSNIYWGSNFTSITKNLLSPSGIVNADTFVNNVGANRSIVRGISVVSGNTYVLSFWIKKISGAFVNSTAIQLSSFGPAVASQTYTDIGTTLTTDWVRYTHTFTATSTNTVFVQLISNEINTIGVWGAQLEAGAYATSYIPTTSASVTRNYDIPSLSNVYTNGFISASGGTWYSHLLNNVPRTRDSGGGVGLRLTNVAGNNLFHISTPSGANQRYWIRKIVGGTNTDLYNTITNEIKVAIKWNGTTADVFVNGVEVVSATAFTSVDLENLNVNNPNIPYSINAMTLFPTPLTDAECIALTTI